MSIIELEISGLDAQIKELTSVLVHLPKKTELALQRASNRTLESVRSKAIKISGEEYTTKASAMRKHSQIMRAGTGRAGRLVMRSTYGMSLAYFLLNPGEVISHKGVNPHNRTVGLQAKTRRRGSYKDVVNADGNKAFLARTKDGNLHVFARTKNKQGNKVVLERLFGPSGIFALTKDGNRETLEHTAAEAFTKRLQHEVNFILTQGK